MNRNIRYWVLYDFANSFLAAALEGLYFSQWVIIDNKFPDIWYGAVFSAATLVLLITAPFLGSWSDAIGRKMPFLKITTLAMGVFGIILGVIANSYLPTFPKVLFALGAFFFLQYFYQASLTFYNPLLDQLASNKNRGLISGIGQLVNNFGYVLATGVFLLLVQNHFTLFGEAGRNQVFLPATILFIFLSLPMMFRFKERAIDEGQRRAVNAKQVYTNTVNGIRELFTRQRNVGIFLVAFMLISDAILTFSLFFAIFMQEIYHIPDSQKFILLGLMSLIVIPSCYLSGKLGDKFGLKKILLSSCLILIISFLLASISTSVRVVYGLILFIGLGWGGYYTSARALLVAISPPKQLGEYFGFYSTFQKFASIIGPLTWGGITFFFINMGPDRYRVAVFALVILMTAGTLLLTRVREEKSNFG